MRKCKVCGTKGEVKEVLELTHWVWKPMDDVGISLKQVGGKDVFICKKCFDKYEEQKEKERIDIQIALKQRDEREQDFRRLGVPKSITMNREGVILQERPTLPLKEGKHECLIQELPTSRK